MYKTKQKDALLSFFKENNDKDYTSDYIMSYLNNHHTNVGKTTLYRQLDDLINKGIVKRFYNDELKRYSFQYINRTDCDNHFHLKCIKCGIIEHLECNLVNNLLNHIYDDHHFIIDKKTMLYGTCINCKEK